VNYFLSCPWLRWRKLIWYQTDIKVKLDVTCRNIYPRMYDLWNIVRHCPEKKLRDAQFHYLIFHKSRILSILKKQDVVLPVCVCVCVGSLSIKIASWSNDWSASWPTTHSLSHRQQLVCYSFHAGASLPTQTGIDATVYVLVFAFTHKLTYAWCTHTHTHTHSSILSILQLCQILEFQIFMKSTLSAIGAP